MIRLIIFVVFLGVVTVGLSWFADRPGTLVLNWLGYEIETSFYVAFVAVFLLVAAALVCWSVLRHLVGSPAAIYRFFDMRRRRRGHEALSSGLIAISAGDKHQAVKFANLARQALPNDPMTALLRAQTAQLCGDRATARRIYAAMIEAPDTELLGLRGLFLEAQRENEAEAARQFAERAMQRDPRLGWAVEALFDIQCKAADWAGALATLSVAKAQKHFDKASSNRKRAVLLTAQAIEAEEREMDKALVLSQEAHHLAPDLTPAAVIAGRILASKGNISKAAKIVSRSWKLSPQPDLAVVYAFARPGDATRDRLIRVRKLAAMTPHNMEGPIAVAQAAIEAAAFEDARKALEPLLRGEPTQRVCTLMARIEAGETGNEGRVREWLARGLRAPRDPVWTADGYVSDHWQPVSPVTGRLDAFAWKVPVEAMERTAVAGPLEELAALEKNSANVMIGADVADKVTDERTEAEPKQIESDVADSGAVVPVAAAVDASMDASTSSSSKEVARTSATPVVTTEKKAGTSQATTSSAAEGSATELKVVGSAKDDAAPEPTVEKGDEKLVAKSASWTGIDEAEAQASAASSGDDKTPQTVPQTGERGKSAEAVRRAAKPKIFVPPRAPDDPGPEPLDPDEARTPLARYRMPAPKGS